MTAIAAGSRAIDFSLKGLDGKDHSLEGALRNGPVLVVFYKASCPVCQFTLPFVDRFHRYFKDTKAQVWAVSQDDADVAREFVAEYELAMSVLLEDVDHYTTSNGYGITHVPTLFLIGQAGDVLQSVAGFSRQDLIQIGRKLETLTGKKGFVPFTADDEVPDFKPG